MPLPERIFAPRYREEISKPSQRRAIAGAELGPEQQSGPMVTAKDRDIEEAPKVPAPREKSSG